MPRTALVGCPGVPCAGSTECSDVVPCTALAGCPDVPCAALLG